MDAVPGMNLTHEEARQRATIIEQATYEVTLDLTTGPETFRARTVVRFASSSPGASTFIDLVARQVHEVTFNGARLDPAEVFDKIQLQLPELAVDNELDVTTDNVYINTGEKLHRFV